MSRIMLSVLSRLKWGLRSAAARATHPHIHGSRFGDLSKIDPTTRMLNSSLQGLVTLGPGTVLDECRITANCSVTVGAHSILSGPVHIVADLNPVSIGKYCSLAPNVAIWESLHISNRITTFFVMSEIFGERFGRDMVSKGAIVIGNDVWIGTKAVILSGVTIGDGAIIGAGSIVASDVPSYAIVAGSPAVILKSRFSTEICRRLLDLRWWDWDEDKIRRNRPLFESELNMPLLDRIS